MFDCLNKKVQSKILGAVHSRREMKDFFNAVQVAIFHLKEYTCLHEGLA